MDEITKEDFEAYEEVRVSGLTNMWMAHTVSEMSGLDREMVLEILKNYTALEKKYPDVRKE